MKEYEIDYIENYSGCLFLREDSGRFYWGMRDCSFPESIYEISEELFDLIMSEHKPKELIKEKSIFDEK